MLESFKLKLEALHCHELDNCGKAGTKSAQCDISTCSQRFSAERKARQVRINILEGTLSRKGFGFHL